MIGATVETLFDEQLNDWQLAADNYRGLEQVRTKTFEDKDILYKVQFNPARITSSSAKIDTQSLRARPCFLCPHHLPAEQRGIPFKTRYQILVNPFPIFPRHLTIPDIQHTEQRIKGRIEDMLDLAQELEQYIVFYNGPKCGASAPDHFHFQAGNKELLPIGNNRKKHLMQKVGEHGKASLWYTEKTYALTLFIESEDKADAITLFDIVYRSMETLSHDDEPMMNLLTWHEDGKWVISVFSRAAHRPSCYYAEGEKKRLISPGAVDMGGLFITPLENDFNQITLSDIRKILEEVCIHPEAFNRLLQTINEHL